MYHRPIPVLVIALTLLFLAAGGCSHEAADDPVQIDVPAANADKAGAAPLYFISDVQINNNTGNTAARALSAVMAGRHAYDAGDVVEHGIVADVEGFPTVEEMEYDLYVDLFPNTTAVPGNHDHLDGLLDWPFPAPLVDEYRSGIHVVGFDTELRDIPQHRQWLTAALDDADFTILFLHHQLYSDNLRNGSIAATIRGSIGAIAEQAELVITGHGHAYEHHLVDGTHYLVIGGGGAPLDQVGTSATQVMSESVHHYVKVTPLRDATVHVEVMRLDGSIIESFVVTTRPKVIPPPDYEFES